MKRFLGIALLTLAVTTLVGCKQTKLKQLVNTIDKECPYSIGMMGEMTKAEIKDGNVVITCEVNEQYCNIATLRDNSELAKKSVLANLNSSSGDIQLLVEELKKCDAGITYAMVGKTSGERAEIVISNEEIKSSTSDPSSYDPMEAIDAQIAITKAQLPMQVDEMTTFTDICREGDNVVYIYNVDESEVSVADLENARDVLESTIMENLKGGMVNDRALNQFISACREANAKIVYRYVSSTTGQQFSISISPNEI